MIREQIRQTPEYQQLAQQPGEQEQAQVTQRPRQTARGAAEPMPMGAVLNWEKSDVEFWIQVAQLLLLFLILRELQGGGF